MPYERPSLSTLRAQAAADINAALPGVDALLRYSNLGILGDVLACLASGMYGYLDWIAQQSVPFTATGEHLEGWAALKKVMRNPATNAGGFANFAGTNGKVVPLGVEVARADGFVYLTSAAATVIAGVAVLPIRAVEAGKGGNATVGTQVTLGIGVAGVSGTGTISAAATGGADVETDAELRSRMLLAYAKPPQGGSIDDYGEWALAVPGVTRIWAVPGGMGAGSVVLYFMMDVVQAPHAGFPQGLNGCSTLETRGPVATGDQLALANALFLQQPVTALVYAAAPNANTIDFTISGIGGASDTTKAGIAAAIDQALRVGARPGGVTNVSVIEAAIAAVPQTSGFVLTSLVASAGLVAPGSAGNIISNIGALPVRGAVAYT